MVTANNLAPAGAEGLDHDFVAGKSSSPRWGGFPGRVDQSQGFAKSAHPWLSSFGSSGAFNARVFNLHRVAGGNTIMKHYSLPLLGLGKVNPENDKSRNCPACRLARFEFSNWDI